MKTFWTLVLTAAAALSAAAQTTPRVKADIPFAFRAGQAVLPAGQYYMTFDQHPAVLHIRDEAGKCVALVATNRTSTVARAKESVLVFNRYGNSAYLSKVWLAGNVIGSELGMTKAEREARRAANGNAQVAQIPLH